MKASYPEQEPNVETLIVDNMNLVKKIAWHMHGRVRSAIEIEDLMQIGYFGLVTAAQKYSPKEGATFASYAVLRIRGAKKITNKKNGKFGCARGRPHALPTRPAGQPHPRAHPNLAFFVGFF